MAKMKTRHQLSTVTTIDLEPHEQFEVPTRWDEKRVITQVRFLDADSVRATAHRVKKDGTASKVSSDMVLYGTDLEAMPKWLQHLHLAHQTTVQGHAAEVASWGADATVGP